MVLQLDVWMYWKFIIQTDGLFEEIVVTLQQHETYGHYTMWFMETGISYNQYLKTTYLMDL